jgi:hypothetical protein
MMSGHSVETACAAAIMSERSSLVAACWKFVCAPGPNFPQRKRPHGPPPESPPSSPRSHRTSQQHASRKPALAKAMQHLPEPYAGSGGPARSPSGLRWRRDLRSSGGRNRLNAFGRRARNSPASSEVMS